MDSIAGLVVLIIIIGLIEKFGKNSRKNRGAAMRQHLSEAAQAAAARQTVRPPSAASPAPSAAAVAPASKLSVIESALMDADDDEDMETVEAGETILSGLPMGASFTDEEGCIGGSMGAHDEEGESRAEHALHIAERNAALAAEHSLAAEAARLRSAGRSELRRAVIMAEILDKPKSLRRR